LTKTTLGMGRFDGQGTAFALRPAGEGNGGILSAPLEMQQHHEQLEQQQTIAKGVEIVDEIPAEPDSPASGPSPSGAGDENAPGAVAGSTEGGGDDDGGAAGGELPNIGATMALSGKCAAPDYGTRLFYIKNKHTRGGTLAGILRRVGALHSMAVADPPDGKATFASSADFHRVAQGRCVDMLVAHTARAPWLDKAFKGGLRITSVRPLQAAANGCSPAELTLHMPWPARSVVTQIPSTLGLSSCISCDDLGLFSSVAVGFVFVPCVVCRCATPSTARCQRWTTLWRAVATAPPASSSSATTT
jgi:hypothetical protein